MNNIYNNKINILKALAILVVVSGHLEFSIIPMFPPYSFQVILFFFIAGMLYKENYTFFEFVYRRIKSLLFPYFLYSFLYLGITILITPIIGKFWGLPITLKNELLMPFLTGHHLDLISPLWFVPCLLYKDKGIFKIVFIFVNFPSRHKIAKVQRKYLFVVDFKNNVCLIFCAFGIFI